MKLDKKEKEVLENIIEKYVFSHKTCPTALHVLGQQSTTALWLVLQAAHNTGTLELLKKEIFENA